MIETIKRKEKKIHSIQRFVKRLPLAIENSDFFTTTLKTNISKFVHHRPSQEATCKLHITTIFHWSSEQATRGIIQVTRIRYFGALWWLKNYLVAPSCAVQMSLEYLKVRLVISWWWPCMRNNTKICPQQL